MSPSNNFYILKPLNPIAPRYLKSHFTGPKYGTDRLHGVSLNSEAHDVEAEP
jgi:hypothetical protein